RRDDQLVPAGRQTSPVQARQGKPRREGNEREARLKRGIAQATLEMLREREQEAPIRRQSEDDGNQRGAHSRCAEDALGDQRRAAPTLDGTLDQAEDHDRDDAQDQGSQHPRGPALLVAEHEWDDEQQHRRGERDQSAHIERPGRSGLVEREEPTGGHQQHEPDRYVDKEYRPPARAEEIGTDQYPAEDLADKTAKGKGGRPGAEGLGTSRSREVALDQAEDLRNH